MKALVGCFSVALLTAILVWQSIETGTQLDLARENNRYTRQLVDCLVDLKTKSIETCAYDYSYWDELVENVQQRDLDWAAEMLGTSLTTYNASGIWTYDAEFDFVYSSRIDTLHAYQALPLPEAAFRAIRQKGPFSHFFLQTPAGLLEIRGAQIHRTSDVARTGRSYGYLFVGKLWDREFLQDLSNLSSGTVTLVPEMHSEPLPSAQSEVMSGYSSYTRPLTSWNGQEVARLDIVVHNKLIEKLGDNAALSRKWMIGFVALLFVLLFLSLRKWISHPLESILNALHNHERFFLQELVHKQSDFGELARLVQLRLDQDEVPVEAEEARRYAEARLEKTRAKLETRMRPSPRTDFDLHKEIEERLRAQSEIQILNGELMSFYDSTISSWSKALDRRDNETEGHSQRVTELSLRLACALGVPDEELTNIKRGALLHDIGKMGIPEEIVHKPGKLTPKEFEIMKLHPVYAYQWLSPIPFLRSAVDIPYCHHEKYDGTGYPRGLKGEGIPLAARIFAVVDVWDALTSPRSYREAWPFQKAYQHLKSLRGTHFDPVVLDTFFKILEKDYPEQFRPIAS